MPRVAILTSGEGWHVQALRAALQRAGVAADQFPITRFLARIGICPSVSAREFTVQDYDAILIRIIPEGSLEQIVYRMDVLHQLVARGIRVMNSPATIERTVDKFYTSSLLERAGIPTPKTVVTETFDEALEACRAFGDAVVKPLFGSGGRGMVRVSDPEIAYRTLKALEFGRYVFYVQAFVPHGDSDIRALVVGDQVVAAMRRRSPGWRHNVSRGAMPEACKLDAEAERLCLGAAQAVAADYAGVDLLEGMDGSRYVLEVNGIPGWSGLQRTTEVDIAGRIVDQLLRPLGR